MGKRGPKPRPAKELRERPAGVRLLPDLRQKLEQAAQKQNRSLSREIETRLLASFGLDPAIKDLFGNHKTYWLFQRMAMAVSTIHRQTGLNWWEDRFTFDQMTAAINTGLEMVKPKGGSVVPDKVRRESKQLPPNARTAPEQMGQEAMLIVLWAINHLADPPPGWGGVQVIGAPEDGHAANFLANDLTSSPLAALSKLKRSTRKG